MLLTFQRDCSQILKKVFSLGCKSVKKLGEDLHTFQRGRERVFNSKFSKVKALRKWRSETNDKEEICLKSSQVEGNIKVIVVTSPNIPYANMLLVNACSSADTLAYLSSPPRKHSANNCYWHTHRQ